MCLLSCRALLPLSTPSLCICCSSLLQVLELTHDGSLKHLVGVDVIADELKDQGDIAPGEEPHHLEVGKLSTSEVRNLLRRRGLSVTGGLMQLVQRLKETGAVRS